MVDKGGDDINYGHAEEVSLGVSKAFRDTIGVFLESAQKQQENLQKQHYKAQQQQIKLQLLESKQQKNDSNKSIQISKIEMSQQKLNFNKLVQQEKLNLVRETLQFKKEENLQKLNLAGQTLQLRKEESLQKLQFKKEENLQKLSLAEQTLQFKKEEGLQKLSLAEQTLQFRKEESAQKLDLTERSFQFKKQLKEEERLKQLQEEEKKILKDQTNQIKDLASGIGGKFGKIIGPILGQYTQLQFIKFAGLVHKVTGNNPFVDQALSAGILLAPATVGALGDIFKFAIGNIVGNLATRFAPQIFSTLGKLTPALLKLGSIRGLGIAGSLGLGALGMGSQAIGRFKEGDKTGGIISGVGSAAFTIASIVALIPGGQIVAGIAATIGALSEITLLFKDHFPWIKKQTLKASKSTENFFIKTTNWLSKTILAPSNFIKAIETAFPILGLLSETMKFIKDKFFPDKTPKPDQNINKDVKGIVNKQVVQQLAKPAVTEEISKLSPQQAEQFKKKLHEDVSPVKGTLTSSYGYRIHPIKGVRKFHTGIDIAAKEGTPIQAKYGGGVITEALTPKQSGGFGNFVTVKTPQGDLVSYAHLKEIDVKIGQKVKEGQLIGKVGSTGQSTGPHLHFQVRSHVTKQLEDPLTFLAEQKQLEVAKALPKYKKKLEQKISNKPNEEPIMAVPPGMSIPTPTIKAPPPTKKEPSVMLNPRESFPTGYDEFKKSLNYGTSSFNL